MKLVVSSIQYGFDMSRLAARMNPNIGEKRSNLYVALNTVRRTLEHHGVSFVLIGAVALNKYVDPRATKDIDISVLTYDLHYIKLILKKAGFHPVKKSGRLWSLDGAKTLRFFGPGHLDIPVDIIASPKPFFKKIIAESVYDKFTQSHIPTKEALFVLKLIAYHDKRKTPGIDASIKADLYKSDLKKLYKSGIDWNKAAELGKLLKIVKMRKPSWWYSDSSS